MLGLLWQMSEKCFRLKKKPLFSERAFRYTEEKIITFAPAKK
jgi:hypothetical protein